jgi:hypothetical protein
MTEFQLPAYLQNKPSRGIAQALTAVLGVGSPPFLSIMNSRFTLVDSTGAEHPVATFDPAMGVYIDCVIIDALEFTSKIFYDKAFDPNASQYEPPACFSDNGVGPSRNAAKPQAPTCAACPHGAWGSKTSAVSGKGVKACSDIQKLAILVPGYEMPFLLRLPPNSRTNFRGYVNKFAGQQIDLCDVTTRISFEQGVIGTLQFAAVGLIDEPTYVQREKLAAAKATDSMIGRTDLPRQEALAAPAAQPQIAAVQGHPGQESAPIGGAPFQPFAAPPASAPMQAPMQAPVQQAPVQQEAVQQPPKQRQRRSAAAAPAQPAPTAAPFMPPAQAPAAAPAPGPQGAPANFGIQQAGAPDPALQQALGALFGPK